MKNYRFTIIALLAAACLAVACEEDILRDVDECYVTLDAENTYTVGNEVKFDIKGNPDYIYFFPGDTGHQYEYCDRTTVAMEDLENCKLVVSYYADYGLAGSLDVYASKTFEGLKGDDADADLATMRAIEASIDEAKQIPGWEKLAYDEGARKVWTTQEYDITEYADSFCLAFHWNPPVFDQQQRTYWINFSVKTKFKGYDEVTTKGTALGMTSVSLNVGDDPKITDAYYKNSGNGTVIFTDTDKDIKMQGVGAGALKYAINSWIVTKPRPLNNVSPDTGFSVKSVADDITEYGYVYEKSGTYEATFLITNGNYQGAERKLQKMTVNIIDPIGGGDDPEAAPAE
ncbi:MAG: DUF5017 domain-containing protein [Alistipes senegalensis]|nr:DUF5017 domain-containing protein [Bacteroides cellulosilyticus]MCM1352452.1 DUF5017 domain-containing protein [Alistipes senegalensis]